MSALSRQQMTGSNRYYGNFYLLRTISQNDSATSARLCVAAGYESGRAWLPSQTAAPRHNAVAGLAGSTPLSAFFIG